MAFTTHTLPSSWAVSPPPPSSSLDIPLNNNVHYSSTSTSTRLYMKYDEDEGNTEDPSRRGFRTRLSEWRTKSRRKVARTTVAGAAAAFSLNLLRFGNVPPALAAVRTQTPKPPVIRIRLTLSEPALEVSKETINKQSARIVTVPVAVTATVAAGVVLKNTVLSSSRKQKSSSQDDNKAREEQFNDIIGKSSKEQEKEEKEEVSISASAVMNSMKELAISEYSSTGAEAASTNSVFYKEVVEEAVAISSVAVKEKPVEPTVFDGDESGDIFDVEGTMRKSFPESTPSSPTDLEKQLESVEGELKAIEEELSETDVKEDENEEEEEAVDIDASTEIVEEEVSDYKSVPQLQSEAEVKDDVLEITKSETTSAILTMGALTLASSFVSIAETALLIPAVFIGAKALTDDYLARKENEEN